VIRAIGNKRVDIIDQEFEVYKDIVSDVGAPSFNGVFDSDSNGIILCVFSRKDTDSRVIQFLYNIMMNQRLRNEYKIYKALEEKILELELKIKNIEEKVL
jgi:hypothetical protein